MKIGLLTSGGDCAGLNAVMRGFAKAAYSIIPQAEIYGIMKGYAGLIDGNYRKMDEAEFSGILNLGGTVLGSSRTPYKKLILPEEAHKIESMKANYKKMELGALVVLGGNGSHKIASLLSQEGLNVVALPKTIDNDILGTEVTFGFHTAVQVAAECIDRIQTTAASHNRAMAVEIMGNKTGWLTLYAGLAGGAHIIIIPEIPFTIDKIIEAVKVHMKKDGGSCVIAIAEGAADTEEAALSKKDRYGKRAEIGETTASMRIVKAISEALGEECRLVIPGHIQRGGSPTAYDRLLCTEIGAFGARFVGTGRFGVSVAMIGGRITYNRLSDIFGSKLVAPDHDLIRVARDIGVSFGD
ncbi:MAG: ATP-dependent 6-phosphofructokinase [Chitinispirillia bacterium]|nr:ATP-dependent 6-phosphofructokinase [Chitinispirillia bacterium]